MATSNFHQGSTDLTLPPDFVKNVLFLKLVLGPNQSPWGMVGLTLAPYGSTSANRIHLFILAQGLKSSFSHFSPNGHLLPYFLRSCSSVTFLNNLFSPLEPLSDKIPCSGVPHPLDYKSWGLASRGSLSIMLRNSGWLESEAQHCHLPALWAQTSYFIVPSLGFLTYKMSQKLYLLLRLNDLVFGPAPETLQPSINVCFFHCSYLYLIYANPCGFSTE